MEVEGSGGCRGGGGSVRRKRRVVVEDSGGGSGEGGSVRRKRRGTDRVKTVIQTVATEGEWEEKEEGY